MKTADKLLIRALRGETLSRPPVWLMRQAGRYLPEYRATRAKAGSFLDLCYSPEHAIEVTLQPIRRFGFDASILFSDILVVPHALGQKVAFEEGRGPVLEALADDAAVARLTMDQFHQRLKPVYEAVSGIRAALPAETALIGFAGAPWTVASYMIEGGSSKDYARIKAWAYGRPDSFQRLINLVVEATAQYLNAQIEAGAEALQLFDSWAGSLDHAGLLRWCYQPMKAIIDRVRMSHPDVPVIVFPRGAGAGYLDFARQPFMHGLGLDTGVPLDWAFTQLQGRLALQGNLDPQWLVVGGEGMRLAATRILDTLGHGPFIFNLGHGIVPETPPEHVAELVELVRNWQR
ncbi:uroporphyrinogen decarboxylase [Dongia mobilis]|uniref:Uroporphyrinogen decarboxylase n=1 Tax=Dongia mobilis TaxID=578943 RepID=A0A4R6WR03_9PROT|nr:uroporphyrinogen decarboxylase [Dongia mobilis]TDQ81947.1 uroporphyrinogen decarboxylase [Dongia mobilis]